MPSASEKQKVSHFTQQLVFYDEVTSYSLAYVSLFQCGEKAKSIGKTGAVSLNVQELDPGLESAPLVESIYIPVVSLLKHIINNANMDCFSLHPCVGTLLPMASLLSPPQPRAPGNQRTGSSHPRLANSTGFTQICAAGILTLWHFPAVALVPSTALQAKPHAVFDVFAPLAVHFVTLCLAHAVFCVSGGPLSSHQVALGAEIFSIGTSLLCGVVTFSFIVAHACVTIQLWGNNTGSVCLRKLDKNWRETPTGLWNSRVPSKLHVCEISTVSSKWCQNSNSLINTAQDILVKNCTVMALQPAPRKH